MEKVIVDEAGRPRLIVKDISRKVVIGYTPITPEIMALGGAYIQVPKDEFDALVKSKEDD